MKVQKYAIIAGTSKAGTTSVFNYLAVHPEICPASLKETRFFLDAEYPLKQDVGQWDAKTFSYPDFFESRHGRSVALEATPDYMYSAGTPAKIREQARDARLIFILRDPASRLVSWYRFGRAMNEVPLDLSFDKFVEVQAEREGLFPGGISHPAFLALPHGKYSMYLERFASVFGPEQIYVGLFEDLSKNPRKFLADVCRFLEVDDKALDQIVLKRTNETVNVRNPKFHRSYDLVAQNLRYVMRSTPVIRAAFRTVGNQVDRLYRRVNIKAKEEPVIISPKTERLIADYYRDEPEALRRMFGVNVGWSK